MRRNNGKYLCQAYLKWAERFPSQFSIIASHDALLLPYMVFVSTEDLIFRVFMTAGLVQ
jgi:hypothetical protein